MFSHLKRTSVALRWLGLNRNHYVVKPHLPSSPISSRHFVATSWVQCTAASQATTTVDELTSSPQKTSSGLKAETTEILEVATGLYNSIENEVKKSKTCISFVAKEECHKVLELLIRYKVAKEDIEDVLTAVPVLLTFPYSVWDETVKQLIKTYNFSSSQLLPVLASTPSFLEGLCWKSLTDVLAILRAWGIREGKMQTVIVRNRDILHKSTKSILTNYANLCGSFTVSEVKSLLMSNPVVLTDEWKTTHAKILYVCEKMGLKRDEILMTNLFKHSLTHIIIRHEFLEKAGIYSKPDKNGFTKTEKIPLRIIIDSSDKAFAKLVAGMTLDEYLVFAQLKMEELEEELESEDELSE